MTSADCRLPIAEGNGGMRKWESEAMDLRNHLFRRRVGTAGSAAVSVLLFALGVLPPIWAQVPHGRFPTYSGPDYKRIPIPSCTAGDSLLGPMDGSGGRAEVNGGYSSSRDASILFTGPITVQLGDRKLEATGRYQGRAPAPDSLTRMTVMLPTKHVPATLTDSLIMVLDDSVRLNLGVPSLVQLKGESVPPFIPVAAAVSLTDLAAIARAHQVRALYGPATVKASDRELRDLGGFVRVVACQVTLPDIR
jgi:hypothetical protein